MTERHLDDDELRLLAAVGRGPDGRSTDIESGLGVPRWMSSMLRFCSRCGAPLASGPLPTESRDRLACAACGFIAYVNPRLVVTTIPVTDAGEAVLIRRGIDPGYGDWAQPGGFLEIDETVSEAAVRETLEETGLVIEPGAIVGVYSRLEAAVVVIVYEARIIGGSPRPNPEALEITAFTADRIPWDRIAFKTSYWALRDWVLSRHPGVTVPPWSRGPAANG